MSSEYAMIPSNYLCKKCGILGDHWIMECDSNSVSLWKKLPRLPYNPNCVNKPFFDRKSKLFVVLPGFIGDSIEKAVIWKYSFLRSSWERYRIEFAIEQSFDFYPVIMPLINPVGISSDGCKIYVYCDSNEVAILELMSDINVCKLKVIKDKDLNVECLTLSSCVFGSGIMVEDEFHIIHEKHVKYDVNTEKFEILCDLPKKICYGGLIKVGNKLWSFGGFDYKSAASDAIYEYDIVSNHWEFAGVKLPYATKFVSCASIFNGQMILVFGVSYREKLAQGFYHIFIYEIATKIIKKSTINLPIDCGRHIFAVNEIVKDAMIISGWIREQWCSLSEDLVKVILGYYINEVIHLLSTENGGHFEINAFDILHYC